MKHYVAVLSGMAVLLLVGELVGSSRAQKAQEAAETLTLVADSASAATDPTKPLRKLGIPKSLQVEHEEIHAAVVKATKARGRVGAAAQELAKVLDPHFMREQEIALPPLGLLAALAAGERIPDTVISDAVVMTDTLRVELPQMLAEHQKIRAAVEKLRLAARAAKAAPQEQLAEKLALHAQNEEEVLYPAALLVGDVFRASTTPR